jgi:hypothetical protein
MAAIDVIYVIAFCQSRSPYFSRSLWTSSCGPLDAVPKFVSSSGDRGT